MSKRVFVVIVSIVIAIVCVLPTALCTLLLGAPFIQEWRPKQKLEIMDGADHLFEDYSVYGAGSGLRSIYYWIDEPTDAVRNYYEDLTDIFLGKDDDGTWYIGLIEGDQLPQQSGRRYIIHESFCSYRNRYDCVSIALVDARQPDLHRLAVSSPGQFKRSEIPPEFASLPERGTLIIFKYYVSDF